MAILKKANIQAPTLPKETVDVPELGGEVVVSGLLLKDRIELFAAAETGGAQLSRLLAATVLDADGVPVYTQEEWEQFGAQHFAAALRLFDVARRLSGLDAEVAKKN